MKKFIFIFLLSFSSLLSYSQLFEDFEAAPNTADASGVWALTSGNWLVKDNRTNTGINWQNVIAPFPANGGAKAAFVNRENTGAGVLAEEWLITPQRNILANSQLRFFTRQTLAGDTGTKYQIRASSAADPADLSQYTLVIEYTESELSTLTSDQLDYEEKVINLAFTGQRYLAFVKVFTQPTGATGGDRWLVDDVKIVERCLDPVAPLGTPVIGATTTRLEWTSTNTTFQVQYGPAGFTIDVPAPNVVISPVFTNTNAPRRRYEATGLLANTAYQFYVRAVCADSNSNWVGPFNWNTLPLGRTCSEPIVAPSIPYSDSSNTSIYGNNIIFGSPGGAALCGAGAGFLGGNDVVYSYTPTAPGNIFISMNPNGSTNTGVFVYNSCASVGTTCIAGVGNATSNIRVIPSLAVVAGQTYYIVISSTTATPTFPYTLTIQQATCPQTAPSTTTNIGPTSANATWVNGAGSTATAWEVAVQTAGADVPTGAGTATTVNTNYLMNATLDGAPLTAGTAYQYWVRAACGDGLFSPWSGPFLFTTTLCELANQCNYEFVLSDLVGGWEGGRMEVRQNGVVLATLGATITGVGPVTVPVALCTNLPFELFWSVGGNFPDEIRVAVRNNFGQTLYALTTNGQTSIGTPLYTGMVDCLNPMCLRPTANPTVPAGAGITFNSAIVTWNVAGSSTTTTTGWGIYVVPQGSPAPTLTTAPMYTTTGAGPTVSFNITGPPANLLPDTNYTVYVQALCSVNGPSEWTTGTNFRTKEQCPKPTALTATAITPFGATFGWTNPTGTAWQIIVQLATEPEPAADDIRWGILAVTAPPYLYNGAPLIPETGYEYYIRTDCGGGILSTPAGPRPFTTGIACPKPTGLGVSAITTTGATFNWTNAGATAWQVLVLPAGSPAPTAGSTGWVEATSNPFNYTLPALTPETNYVYYVRTDCGGVNGLSTWAGPRAFTTAPACFKPTALSSNTLGAFSVTLTWDSVATTTAWQIFALPQGSPAPTIDQTGFVSVTTGTPGFLQLDANSFSYVFTGLTPETPYSFYIRGNCDPFISNPVGPRNVTTTPSCYKPSAQTATLITPFNPTQSPFNVNLGWTNNVNSPVTEWQISIQATGSPAPAVTQVGTTVTANPYLATGLTPNTCYDYYVRSVCGGVNGVSTWTGPFNFCTPPTCPQPTGLGSTNPNEPTANLFWTEAGTATQWEYIFQAPLGPVPGSASSGTITSGPAVAGVVTVNTNTLAPGFYEFYVRSICSDSDKSFWTGPKTFFIALPPAVCASVDIDVTTTSPGVIDLCPGESCVDLVAEFTDSKDTSTYTVLPVLFAPPFPFTGGTQLPVTTDDVWSAPFTLPFNFCFYGVNYPTVNVGSNGVLTFNTQAANSNCPWSYTQSLPDPTMPILNAIYGVYQDINPAVDTAPIQRSINYQILGEAPCRAFVVNYYNIAQFSCNLTLPLQTSQIVLYETSNIIEVYVQDRVSCTGWNGGRGVIGVQNAAGTIAHWPPDRNTGQWEAHDEAWRFTPDGNSNVEFSWLKDGEFYSSEPTINVCVSETTNMTAQALYSGCGGQTATKTENVLLRVNEVIIPPMSNVVACQTYTLPALTVGNYFSQTGGVGPIDPSIPITDLGIRTIYVYAETTTVPACTYEISFTVEIQDVLTAPTPNPVFSCDSYTLPALSSPFNYYTGAAGTGTMYSGLGGDIISTSQPLFIYGTSGLCVAESTFNITIETLDLFPQSSVSDCNNFTLLPLPANNTYYTAPGGPTGTGTIIAPGTVISSTQTIYIYAQFGSCIEEGNFTVNVFGIQPPTVNITQPTCVTTTGTIEVTSPVSPGGVVPSNLFISEVTDSNLGSLTYVELYNATNAPIDLSNYKLKIYNNGNSDPSINCDIALTGTIGVNETNVIKVSTSPNQGGVLPDQVFASCAGVNTNDNIRLTTSADVLVDIWGRTDDTDFTPNNEPGYTYRRNATATIPSTTWNPADWTAIDPEDYSNVGLYAPFSSFVYQYNIDGGPWQFTTTFNNVPLGPHVINVQDITTNCTSFLNVTIQPELVNAPVTTITYTTPVCNSDADISPDTSITGFTNGGTYSANPATLVIDASTGVVNVAGSPAGNYVITYSVLEDLSLCRSAGSSTFSIIINAIETPDFAAIGPFCFETAVPLLTGTSPNGINGTWSPAVIDNLADGSYVFTPNTGLCATTQTLNVTITAPNITPVFAPINDFCAGTAAPQLPAASQNSVNGSWLPALIDNTQSGSYTFTPNAGQCALPFTVNVTVLPSITSDFAEIPTICSGGIVPTLDPTSPNGVAGTWSPSVIDPTQSGTYEFVPAPNQCATGQSLTVVIASNPQFSILPGCLNGNYTLAITSADFDLETATFVWKFENVVVNGQSGPSIIVTQTGNYTCEITYQGCSTEKPISVTTVACTIQKGISPKGTNGGDGKNDYFDLEGQNVTKLEIFNRYGMIVYSKSNYSKEWYGQSNSGDELPDGTYFYVIERNGEKSKTGWIYINHEL